MKTIYDQTEYVALVKTPAGLRVGKVLGATTDSAHVGFLVANPLPEGPECFHESAVVPAKQCTYFIPHLPRERNSYSLVGSRADPGASAMGRTGVTNHMRDLNDRLIMEVPDQYQRADLWNQVRLIVEKDARKWLRTKRANA